jgi:hypothetical protein
MGSRYMSGLPLCGLPRGVDLDVQLVGVRVVQLAPAVVHGVVAADRLDPVAVEQPLGDDEAEVPAGGDLRDPVLVSTACLSVSRVPSPSAASSQRRLSLPQEYSSSDGASARVTCALRASRRLSSCAWHERLGGVPEWLNGAVSKTVVRLTAHRGFESLPLR